MHGAQGTQRFWWERPGRVVSRKNGFDPMPFLKRRLRLQGVAQGRLRLFAQFPQLPLGRLAFLELVAIQVLEQGLNPGRRERRHGPEAVA
jgi:hypothetical protein